MAKATSRDLQAKETKNRIYETAVELLKEKGVEQVSISEICKKAGVSVGLFYYYFPSKTDIIFEKFSRADEYFDREVRSGLTADSAAGRIRQYCKAYFAFVESEGLDFVRNFYTTTNTFFVQEGRAMQGVLGEVITAGQSTKEIRADIPVADCVNLVFTVLRGVVFDWCLREGSYDLSSDTAPHLDMIIRYLTT